MSLSQKAESIASEFVFSDDDVRKCSKQFIFELDKGLKSVVPTVCQIPTYVTKVARGTEKGVSLAVDLGGTNLRVCSVELNGDTTLTAKHAKKVIPPGIMTAATGAELFHLIAHEIDQFLQLHHRDALEKLRQSKDVLPLGFTFSYPAYQTSINSGILLRWTKGFVIPDVVNKDVCQLLQVAIDEFNLPVEVTALVNDALGALMFRTYTLPLSQTRTSVGAIFGTGTNGVYLEKLSNITKSLGNHDDSTGEMFISCEWGSFDNGLLVQPNTTYDVKVDQISMNPGNQMFEKRVSGMFQGELLRVVLNELYADPDAGLFRGVQWNDPAQGEGPAPFFTPWAIDTSLLSMAAADNAQELPALSKALVETLRISADHVSADDVRAVKTIADAIGKRAARLAGMAIASVLIKGGRMTVDRNLLPVTGIVENPSDVEGVDIAVDGSVVELYPGFERYMREAWSVIDDIGPAGERMIKMGIAKDGSSIGAAIIALIAQMDVRHIQ
ncbi:Actin-like ATPase [Glarea lozoyensis ATCC 20868]|uniref:Phosphotransferase n=1 Tax=Glarea lozoyensis (strain ATCC 20868 / MF5171) TaxID=1116229 RepID=S3CIY1_GLAL2|nr:Actin-like ATPase [Glarea lozoyensis ATCC 20868]EPE26462.1 Actin-like ATPase [Glarea lozoyensis ATCC 20868]